MANGGAKAESMAKSGWQLAIGSSRGWRYWRRQRKWQRRRQRRQRQQSALAHGS